MELNKKPDEEQLKASFRAVSCAYQYGVTLHHNNETGEWQWSIAPIDPESEWKDTWIDAYWIDA